MKDFPFDEDSIWGWIEWERQVLRENISAFSCLCGSPRTHISLKSPIVEVAHQPLYKPDERFYKKIVTAYDLAKDGGGICIFGIIDDDFFIFPRMWSNGREKVKVKDEKRAFCVAQPEIAESNSKEIMRVLREDYGVSPLAFRYSTLPVMKRQKAFFERYHDEYRAAYNASLGAHKDNPNIAKMKPIAEGELPLWKINADGTKETLKLYDSATRIGFKAVARNFAFAEFLRTDVYVSGKGAANSYGIVAHDVAKALNIKEPREVVI